MTNKIRIRNNLRRAWVWELVTPDGHVAACSDEFGDRDRCETDALAQGLPVTGLRKAPGRGRGAAKPGLTFYRDRSQLWLWQQTDDRGTLIASSAQRFLTRKECVEDAERQGYAVA